MKKRTKKLISMSLASIMALSLAGCGGSSGGSDSSKKEGSGDAGKTLNIWCWNDEFQSRFNDYYPEVEKVSKDKSTTTLKDGTVVKWTINPNENNNYQNKLDEALLNQEKASADDKIDIFLIEADYALKYVDSDYTMDIKDLGLTDDDLSEQYQYTKDIVTIDGTQKGTTWQATPGLFAYRRSIAKMFSEQTIRNRYRQQLLTGISSTQLLKRQMKKDTRCYPDMTMHTVHSRTT